MAALVASQAITHVTLPPIVLSGLPDGALASVEVLVCAGEALPRAQAKRWASGRRMFNAYGPTETTIWSSVHACDPESTTASVPIGRAIDGHRIHLLEATIAAAHSSRENKESRFHVGALHAARERKMQLNIVPA